ncbi:MAG: nucleotidyltransferase [bacterium]|nr:nucleotidyltransferase [bacterium]
MEQEKLLREVAEILKKLDIPYIITGGIAVVVWGRPRFTADIDIVVELKSTQIDRLASELLKIDKDVYIDKRMMQRALFNKGEFNFIHSGSGLKVDFWILKNNVFDRERLKRRIKKNIAGTDIYLSSPEDLILIKLLWYNESESTRQIEDVESILKIQKKLDMKYVRKWAKLQDTISILEELLVKQLRG